MGAGRILMAWQLDSPTTSDQEGATWSSGTVTQLGELNPHLWKRRVPKNLWAYLNLKKNSSPPSLPLRTAIARSPFQPPRGQLGKGGSDRQPLHLGSLAQAGLLEAWFPDRPVWEVFVWSATRYVQTLRASILKRYLVTL